MAGISCIVLPSPTLHPLRTRRLRCFSMKLDANNRNSSNKETPRLIGLAVSGVTELLRVFSPRKSDRSVGEGLSHQEKEGIAASTVDDVMMILKSDFEKAYFVTGVLTAAIYTEDCIFEDPTIRFSGRDLYERNLKLLVPFFDHPSILLKSIQKGRNVDKAFILAKWKLRTYLKLPWRPLISIYGSTIYELDGNFKIIRHAESWNVSALEAIGQIFTPCFWRPTD